MTIFTEKDFESVISNSKFADTLRAVVHLANNKLSKLIGPKIFMSQFKDQTTNQSMWAADQEKTSADTHEAFLFNIKPLEEEPCKHVPEVMSKTIGKNEIELLIPFCIKCGQKICAVKWELI